MGDAPTGGFVTDLTLTSNLPASGCCGGTSTQPASASTQVASCCGEPVAVMEPEETASASSDSGCCGSAEPQQAAQESSTCCG
jgi:hypothetical protein